jgi:hypothetical protein
MEGSVQLKREIGKKVNNMETELDKISLKDLIKLCACIFLARFIKDDPSEHVRH